MVSVLVPWRLDTGAPIATIHKEVARRIEADVYGFAPTDVTIEGIHTLALPSTKLKKGIAYGKSYFSDFDIIHCGMAAGHAPILPLAQILPNSANVLTTIHNAEYYGREEPTAALSRRSELMSADTITAVSKYVRGFVRDSYDKDSIVIPNGVDTQLFSPEAAATQQNQILYIGRNASRKNASFVLDIAKKLQSYEFRVRVSGLGDNLENTFESRENITVLDYMPVEQLVREYASAEIVVAPFEREGFGLSVLESLACGTPVVGLDDGNLTELLATDGGMLISELAPDRWVAAIRNHSLDENEARQKAKEFDWDKIAPLYSEQYQKLAVTNEVD